MTRVTIADVAARAQLSTATVSKALRGLPVAPASRDRVLAAAKELGWRPHPHASRLASGRSGAVGLVMAYSGLWYDVEVLTGVEAAIVAAGLDLLVWTVQSLEARDRGELRPEAIAQRVDGLIFMDFVGDPQHHRAIARLPIPTVAVGSELPGSASFGIDNQAAAAIAVGHLIRLGHTRIGLVSGPAAPPHFSPVPSQRRAGYRRAHQDAGLPYDPDLEVDGGFTPEGAAAALARLLRRRRPPTAVFCLSDEMALGVLAAAAGGAVAVPGDLSVVGFDDHPLAGPFGLTTVRQPIAAMTEAAVGHLIQRMDKRQRDHRLPPDPAQCTYFAVELISRRTAGPVAGVAL